MGLRGKKIFVIILIATICVSDTMSNSSRVSAKRDAEEVKISDTEDEEVNEDDCIWEGDAEEEDPMSVVEDEVFDEDDYDRIKEEKLENEDIERSGIHECWEKTKDCLGIFNMLFVFELQYHHSKCIG